MSFLGRQCAGSGATLHAARIKSLKNKAYAEFCRHPNYGLPPEFVYCAESERQSVRNYANDSNVNSWEEAQDWTEAEWVKMDDNTDNNVK